MLPLGKVLTLAALYFSVRHVDVFGAAMLAGAGALCVASKTAAAPAEILGESPSPRRLPITLAVRWVHDEALIHQNILKWVGLRRAGSAAADVLAEARGDAARRGARPRRGSSREGESRVVRGVTARAQDGVRAGTVSSLLARPAQAPSNEDSG